MDWFPLYNSLRIALIASVIVFFSGIFSAYYIATVSYTHLDVYKRQVMLRSPRKKLRYILEIVGASIVYLT